MPKPTPQRRYVDVNILTQRRNRAGDTLALRRCLRAADKSHVGTSRDRPGHEHELLGTYRWL
jgi:hypothetical protein